MTRKIVKIANETGLDSVNATYMDRVLRNYCKLPESLSSDHPKELVEQMHKDDEIGVSEDEERNKLSADFLQNSLATVTEIMDQFIQNDPNFEVQRQDEVPLMWCLTSPIT